MKERLKDISMGEIHEAERVPSISWLDVRLNGGIPGGNGYEGSISFEALAVTEQEQQYYEKLLEDSYVLVAPGAPDRCGDGRATILLPENLGPTERLSMLDELKSQPLGPQLFGGTFGEALPFRLATNTPRGSLSAYDDFVNLVEALREKDVDFVPGSHTDEQSSDSIIGCGKKDKHSQIMSKMANFGLRPALEQQAGMLVADIVDGDTFKETFRRAIADIDELNLPDAKPKYLGTGSDEQQFKHKVLQAVTDIDSEAAPEVKGPHKEAFIVINFIPGQTLNNNYFVNSVENKVQAFNVDFWRVVERAEILFADDVYAKNRYLVTAAIDTIATAMVLTAGDQKVGVRK